MTASVVLRVVVLLSGAALVLLLPGLPLAPAVVTAVGTVLAVTAPRLVGSTVASAGFVLGWLGGLGWDGTPALWRTLAAAAVLYLLHVACSLIAWVPLGAEVGAGVIRRFAGRSVAPIGCAAVVVLLDEAVPRTHGTVLAELAGLIGVVALAAVVAAVGLAGRR